MEANPGAFVAPNEGQPTEERLGLVARLGNVIRNGYEAFQNNLDRYRALGASVIAFAGGAEATSLVVSAESMAADAPAAKVSSVKQKCVSAGLARPQVEFAEMQHAGKVNQRTTLKINYGPMPEACWKNYQRVGQYRILIQDPKHPGAWIDIYSWNNSYFTRNTEGEVQASTAVAPTDTDKHLRCTPGPKDTRARLELRSTVRSAKDRHRIARKSYFAPVDVLDGC